jgi:hypothetical protein
MPKRELRRTKDVCLQVIVCKSDGSAFMGSVDIECRHQTLSDRQVFRQLDASKPIQIGGLRRAPKGLYQLTVTPNAYWLPQAQSVNVPASKFATVKVVISQAKIKPSIGFSAGDGNPREEFEVGEYLVIPRPGSGSSDPHHRSSPRIVRDDALSDLFYELFW